ncbi:MAG: HipA N-terminal domain-containing protein [Proteobacteria bacterium]|nr:HipA N-terminal domain-containing protein [Pseudomonadota bacterium]
MASQTKRLNVYNLGILCGTLTFEENVYTFQYLSTYQGPPISLTMPYRLEPYTYTAFPPFFDGLLPEGYQLEGLLRLSKIDRNDYMAQLAAVGSDMVGTVTVKEISNEETLSAGELL